MTNPFKQNDDYMEARMNARLTADRVQQMLDAKNPVYVARFIHEGVCGYRDQKDITYLSSDALYRMQESFIGRPVILSPHDLNITPDNIAEKAKGTVTECWTDDGKVWNVKFVVTDEKVNKKIQEQGYNFVSCAYIITETGEPAVHDGIECTTVVENAFYHHLAITNSPRYDDSQAWRVNEADDKNCLKNIGISDIVKINESKGKTMFGFLKKEIPVEADLFFDTACGRLNTEEMIAKINELVEENSKLKEEKPVETAEVPAEETPAEEVAEAESVEEKVETPAEEPVVEQKEDVENTEAPAESKENEESHEPSSVLPEAIVKANEELVASDVIQTAIPKENEDNSKVATCTVRGLSAKN